MEKIMQLESIQFTCWLILKLGMEDEQKICDVLYLTAVDIDFRSLEIPPLPNNGTVTYYSSDRY